MAKPFFSSQTNNHKNSPIFSSAAAKKIPMSRRPRRPKTTKRSGRTWLLSCQSVGQKICTESKILTSTATTTTRTRTTTTMTTVATRRREFESLSRQRCSGGSQSRRSGLHFNRRLLELKEAELRRRKIAEDSARMRKE